ncbi:hypothetical protein AC788_13710 [Pseudomonas sp. RIT-PI-a]|nr:hypothetical protein AC788_13710 [Pseudomonas sp. RIT-PI-a]
MQSSGCNNCAIVNDYQPPPCVLLVEDDAELREQLCLHLQRRGLVVQVCERGDAALLLAQREPFDLILLDIMLPGLDGLKVLSQLRQAHGTPVMLMSALGAEQDRISGFTQGADDYLPKPFSLAELDARIDALLRRVALDRRATPTRAETDMAGLIRDGHAQDIHYHQRPAGFTSSEYRLLCTLLDHAGEALSKAFLYQQVLHRSYTRLDRGLDVHVCNIRRKLGQIGADHVQIQAVRGQGYVLVVAG